MRAISILCVAVFALQLARVQSHFYRGKDGRMGVRFDAIRKRIASEITTPSSERQPEIGLGDAEQSSYARLAQPQARPIEMNEQKAVEIPPLRQSKDNSDERLNQLLDSGSDEAPQQVEAPTATPPRARGNFAQYLKRKPLRPIEDEEAARRNTHESFKKIFQAQRQSAPAPPPLPKIAVSPPLQPNRKPAEEMPTGGPDLGLQESATDDEEAMRRNTHESFQKIFQAQTQSAPAAAPLPKIAISQPFKPNKKIAEEIPTGGLDLGLQQRIIEDELALLQNTRDYFKKMNNDQAPSVPAKVMKIAVDPVPKRTPLESQPTGGPDLGGGLELIESEPVPIPLGRKSKNSPSQKQKKNLLARYAVNKARPEDMFLMTQSKPSRPVVSGLGPAPLRPEVISLAGEESDSLKQSKAPRPALTGLGPAPFRPSVFPLYEEQPENLKQPQTTRRPFFNGKGPRRLFPLRVQEAMQNNLKEEPQSVQKSRLQQPQIQPVQKYRVEEPPQPPPTQQYRLQLKQIQPVQQYREERPPALQITQQKPQTQPVQQNREEEPEIEPVPQIRQLKPQTQPAQQYLEEEEVIEPVQQIRQLKPQTQPIQQYREEEPEIEPVQQIRQLKPQTQPVQQYGEEEAVVEPIQQIRQLKPQTQPVQKYREEEAVIEPVQQIRQLKPQTQPVKQNREEEPVEPIQQVRQIKPQTQPVQQYLLWQPQNQPAQQNPEEQPQSVPVQQIRQQKPQTQPAQQYREEEQPQSEPVQQILQLKPQTQPVQQYREEEQPQSEPVQQNLQLKPQTQPVQQYLEEEAVMEPVQQISQLKPQTQPVQQIRQLKPQTQPVQQYREEKAVVEPIQQILQPKPQTQPVQQYREEEQPQSEPVQQILQLKPQTQPVQQYREEEPENEPVQQYQQPPSKILWVPRRVQSAKPVLVKNQDENSQPEESPPQSYSPDSMAPIDKQIQVDPPRPRFAWRPVERPEQRQARPVDSAPKSSLAQEPRQPEPETQTEITLARPKIASPETLDGAISKLPTKILEPTTSTMDQFSNGTRKVVKSPVGMKYSGWQNDYLIDRDEFLLDGHHIIQDTYVKKDLSNVKPEYQTELNTFPVPNEPSKPRGRAVRPPFGRGFGSLMPKFKKQPLEQTQGVGQDRSIL